MTIVLHIVPALFSSNNGVLGGAERYALELARYMAEEVPTRLITFGDRDRHETTGELEIRVIGNARYVRGQRQNPFSSSLFGELSKASVVHCHQQHILTSSLAALAGRLLPHKGVNDLVNAVPADMHLRIIGQLCDSRFYQDLRALSAAKQITFHHDFADSDLVSAYRKALCVVLPSVYRTMYGQHSD